MVGTGLARLLVTSGLGGWLSAQPFQCCRTRLQGECNRERPPSGVRARGPNCREYGQPGEPCTCPTRVDLGSSAQARKLGEAHVVESITRADAGRLVRPRCPAQSAQQPTAKARRRVPVNPTLSYYNVTVHVHMLSCLSPMHRSFIMFVYLNE